MTEACGFSFTTNYRSGKRSKGPEAQKWALKKAVIPTSILAQAAERNRGAGCSSATLAAIAQALGEEEAKLEMSKVAR